MRALFVSCKHKTDNCHSILGWIWDTVSRNRYKINDCCLTLTFLLLQQLRAPAHLQPA